MKRIFLLKLKEEESSKIYETAEILGYLLK